MMVRTFASFKTEDLDKEINEFFESWNNDPQWNYTLVDVKFCYHDRFYVAMVIYNKQSYHHSTF